MASGSFRTRRPSWASSARSAGRSDRWRARASLLEAGDEWAVTRRDMSLETLAQIDDTDPIGLPGVAT